MTANGQLEVEMHKKVAGLLAMGALLTAAVASPAAAEPNEHACANGHGTQHAHMTVPEGNHQAHMSIPHFCGDHE